MKKVILFILIVVLAFSIAPRAQAFVAPLSSSGTQLTAQQSISLENCSVIVRPNKNYFSVAADFVLNNSGDACTVNMGLPIYFSSVTAVGSISARYKGSSLDISSKTMSRSSSLGDEQPYYSSMYTWSIDMAAGEKSFVSVSFTVDSSKYTNDTQRMDLPLALLNLWSGNTGRFAMDVYSPYLALYSYDKNPVFFPTSAGKDGIVSWLYTDTDELSDAIVFYSMEDMVPSRYFTNVYTDAASNEYEASRLFRTRDYYGALKIINSSLMDNDDFVFMKLMCHEFLGEHTTALDVLDLIYGREVLESGTSEQNIGDYAAMYMLSLKYDTSAKNGASAKTLYELLSSGSAAISSSSSGVYMLWAQNELAVLEAQIESDSSDIGLATPDPSATPLPPSDSFLENPSITIFGYTLDAKALIIIFIVIIFVLVFIVISIGTSKKSSKKSFRKF